MISFYLEMFFVHIDPSLCASHIMCCAFFMKFQYNTCRNQVETIMKTQKVCLLILNIDAKNKVNKKKKVCLLILHIIGKIGLQKLGLIIKIGNKNSEISD